MPRSSRRNARAHPVGPLGGVAQTRRKVPFARLIDRRVCAFAGLCRPHLRQRSPPWLVDQLRWSGDGFAQVGIAPLGRGGRTARPGTGVAGALAAGRWRAGRPGAPAERPHQAVAVRPALIGGRPDRCRRQLAVLAWPGHLQPRAPAAGAGRPGRLTPPKSTHPMGLPRPPGRPIALSAIGWWHRLPGPRHCVCALIRAFC